jgi:hypothetical protein
MLEFLGNRSDLRFLAALPNPIHSHTNIDDTQILLSVLNDRWRQQFLGDSLNLRGQASRFTKNLKQHVNGVQSIMA